MIIRCILLSLIFSNALFAQKKATYKRVVKIKVIEEDTRKVTPVMACIYNVKDSVVRVPPFGDAAGVPTELEVFFKGVEYSRDKNWVGPIRMTNGKGNNSNRSSLYGMLPSLPYWKDPVMYQTSGDFSIELTPGKWHISLEHGTEYVPISEDFVVTEKKRRLKKTFVFKRWIDLPKRGWYSGDVHIHHPTTKPEFKEYLLAFGKAEDLHIMNMLEMGHHLGTDFKLEGFGKNFRVCKDNICLISGQEDPRTDFGHIIGLNIEYQVRDTSTYKYYDLVFKQLHMQPGALVGYAHFSWQGFYKGIPWHLATEQIDFVELLQFLRLNTLDYYDVLNMGFKITAAAGSDFPWASTIGDVRTFVYTGPTFSPDAWFAGLKAGHTYVSNGPVLFFEANGKLPGTEFSSKSGSTANLKVKAISHPKIGVISKIAIYNNDGLVQEKVNAEQSDSVEIEINHPLKKSQWLAAVAYCENGAVAHTTPVYYLVDGKPTFDRTKGPAIIQKQLNAIEKIKTQENEKANADKGLIGRYQGAIDFYKNLLMQMKAE